MLVHDHPQASAFQAHQGARGVDAHRFDEGLEHRLVEMALAPLGHLADRLGRVPAVLVGAVRGDGVIHVADRAHLGKQADLVALEAMGITTAIDLFVVMQAHVEDHGADLLAVHQDLAAGQRMAAHGVEFAVGELAGLIQDVIGDHHLADVVQQAGHARLAHLLLGQAELAGQGDHQGADRHRVHIGVFVGVLQPRQTDQGIGVAQYRGGNFFHQRHHLTGIDGLAHAHLAEHGHHCGLGAGTELVRAPHLFVQRRTLDHRRRGHSQQAFLDLGGHLGLTLGRATRRQVQALADIDPHLIDAAVADALQVLVAIHYELGFPERMLQPRTTKFVDVHAQT